MMHSRSQKRRPPAWEEVSELYRLVGQATWLAQHLEDALSTSIAIKLNLKDRALKSVSKTDAAEILRKRRSLTFGQSVKLSAQHSLYNDTIQSDLSRVLEDRNWLVHRIVQENGDDMNVDGRREILFEKIDRLSQTFKNLQSIILEDIAEFMKSKGADVEALMQHGERVFRAGRGMTE